ncbi:hypothetical protein H6P81_010876 [Aristolochia fimbriata]|uniref:Anaphase-promoting complex subunit 4-like WD40 domain-containing protein n=1 Tax=Aristolochia fimbriata TaxID=158543 RepID=A0AAV7ESS4_ARIFI|nr:hypothetical protein H6P81_010876 [Aristolochia fimbriata]
MISVVCWIPKGASKAEPVVPEPPTQEEIEDIIKSGALATREESDVEDDDNMDVDAAKAVHEVSHALTAANALGKNSSNGFPDITDALKELDMDHYDEEDDGIELFGSGLGDTYYPSNDVDPYLKDKDDEDDEEIEDLTIKSTDSVVVCARNEDDVSHLEIYILEESEDGSLNMYVHHDVILPAFPLCTAWLDCNLNGGDKGNFIAVGSMEPAIEIWDLDLIDELQPHVVLGGVSEKKKKKGKKAVVKYKKDSHKDSVLGLSWNREVRNVLASASADHSVKVWDIVEGKCAVTMEHHTDKVQSVSWNRHVPEVLLSGSFDRSVVMKDMRSPSHAGIRWSVPADVESLAWDPHVGHTFLVSLEDGTVQAFDIRAAASGSDSTSTKPNFVLHAHDKAVCSISYNPSVPNLLATGSTDKMVKLWDLSSNQPSCIASKNLKAGHVFSVAFSEDSPSLLAVGGDKGRLEVWNTMAEDAVAQRFGRSNRSSNKSSA